MIFTLYGTLYQKGNSRKIAVNRRTGRPMVIKSGKALSTVKDFTIQAQVQYRGVPYKEACKLTATIYYPSRRHDLCASLLCDILEGIAYENDRQIEEMILYKRFDKKNPRVEVEVKEI